MFYAAHVVVGRPGGGRLEAAKAEISEGGKKVGQLGCASDI